MPASCGTAWSVHVTRGQVNCLLSQSVSLHLTISCTAFGADASHWLRAVCDLYTCGTAWWQDEMVSDEAWTSVLFIFCCMYMPGVLHLMKILCPSVYIAASVSIDTAGGAFPKSFVYLLDYGGHLEWHPSSPGGRKECAGCGGTGWRVTLVGILLIYCKRSVKVLQCS